MAFDPKGSIAKNVGLDNTLEPNRPQAITWTNVDQNHWRIYAALGVEELMLSRRWMAISGEAQPHVFAFIFNTPVIKLNISLTVELWLLAAV